MTINFKKISPILVAVVMFHYGMLHAEEQVQAATVPNGDDAPAQPVSYFDVMEYRVEGNTLLPVGVIEQAVYPFLGEKKTIDEVEKARAALEKSFHDAGYLTVLVDIPEQDVNGGVVTLNVTESKVANLRVKGARYFSLGRIKSVAGSLAEGGVPYFPQVQKDLNTLNRVPDRKITPVMRAGKAFGTVDVDLKVEDELPLHASVELNDQYSQNTSHLRLAGSVRYDNLWQREHSLSLQFQVSPENLDEVKVLSANYLWRFDDTDTMLALYGVRSKSNVAMVGNSNVLGDATIAGARVILPVPSLDQYFHSLSLGVDYKHFGQSIEFGGTIDTPVTYMPFSVGYNATALDGSGQTQFLSSLNFNFRGMLTDENEFDQKRPGARSDFFIFKADLQRTQNLPQGWQGFVRLDGQLTGQPLISNEQYLAGGASSVRGYLESEVPGDRAMHSTIELRTPSLFTAQKQVQELRLNAFYDAAKLWSMGTDTTKAFISSYGVGLRVKAFKNLNADLEFAVPLHSGPVTKDGDFRSHFRLWYEL